MNALRTLGAVSLLAIILAVVGCSSVDSMVDAQRRKRMTPLEQFAYSNNKKAQKIETALNAYFTDKQGEFRTIANDADGLKLTRDIASQVQGQVEDLRVYKRIPDYSWPQLNEFVKNFRTVRSRQLNALRPKLTDESGQLSDSGYSYLIHAGMFSDANDPVFKAALTARKRIEEKNLALLRREHDRIAAAKSAQTEEFLKKAILLGFAAILVKAEISHQQAQELKAKGRCPDCKGHGEITVSVENKCTTCLGSGAAYFSRDGLCQICRGNGTIGVARPFTTRCDSCEGSGKYPFRK